MTSMGIAESRTRGAVRRIGALTRGELLLLRRNPIGLFTALGAPLVLVGVQVENASAPGSDSAGGLGMGALVVLSLCTFPLIFSVYYNLTVALVARREELVLKRLRAGELSDGEVLIGVAAPSVAIAVAQAALGILAGFAFLDLAMPANPGLVLAAVALGVAVFVVLAAVSSVLTGSVEMASLTTMPLLLGSMIFSGLMFPLDLFPEPVQQVLRLLPLTAIVDLLRLGLAGVPPGGGGGQVPSALAAGVPALAVLGAWTALGAWATRRWFRWEPRR